MRYLISILFIVATLNAFPQLSKSSIFKNDSLMIENFNNLIDSISNNSTTVNTNELKLSFAQMMNSGKFEKSHYSSICDVLNTFSMQSQPTEIYATYVNTLDIFPSERFKSKDFKNWSAALVNGKISQKILEDWRLFFSENKIYSSQIYSWQLNGGEASIKFENGEGIVAVKKAEVVCDLYDSIVIKNFSGTYNFNEKTLAGKQGKVTWEKAGLNPDDVYAQLPKLYRIQLSRSDITIDSVSFYYKKYFHNTPILGTLKDKCINKGGNEAIYPKFSPYNTFTEIHNIYENIDFSGGFVLDGNKITGSGDEHNRARLIIYHDKKPLIQLLSEHFSFTPKNFSSKDVELHIFAQSDTIHHPSCLARFNVSNKELKITRDFDRSGAAPFFSTYHNLNIYCDELSWKQQCDSIFFSPETTFSKEGTAFFESYNFFSEERFRQFETPDGVNMLLSILKYVRANLDTFYLNDLASYCKISHDQVEAIILNIADYGLISYNHNTQLIKVEDKLYQYIANRSKKRDYDIISIYSDVKNDYNAILNLSTLNLRIIGVERLVLSEKGNVALYPTNKALNIANDMNMFFNGYIRAGLVDIYAQDSHFKYSEFKIEMPQVDSISFYFYTGEYDLTGNPIIDKIYSPIENLTGYLEIDKYYNKSGVIEDNDEYPRFWSTDSAFVYYEKPNICDNVYKRDKFYFLIDPFMVDSLSTYIAENISFSGEFISDGIFENFRENLVIMPGQSLGFKHNIPERGYNLFGNKGTINGTISMSNHCLQVDGTMKYITAELSSTNFLIYPDSINAISDFVKINEENVTGKYPQMYGLTSQVHFDVGKEEMIFKTMEKSDFELYDKKFTFDGDLHYSDSGTQGIGTIRHGSGQISSDSFTLAEKYFKADTSDFKLFLPDNKYTVSEANDYNVYLDVAEMTGDFHSIDPATSGITFKENGFHTDYESFTWQLMDNGLRLGDERAVDFVSWDNLVSDSGSIDKRYHVYSLSKKSDSLNFNTGNGIYDYNMSTLTFNDIDYIQVSDAAIIPVNRSVTAGIGGAIMPITDSYVVINIENKYHTLHQVSATIQSRKQFSGSGYYNYTDSNGNVTPIFMEKISGKDSIVKATAVISELNPLPLNPVVDFQGIVTLTNTSDEINLAGHYHVKQSCFEDNTWITLANNADPDSLVLPINKNNLTLNKKPAFSGLTLSKPGAVLYPSFISEKKKTTDWSIMNIEGTLSFTDEAYTIVDTTFTRNGLEDRHISLYPNQCVMQGADKFNLFEREGRIKLDAGGELTYNFLNDSITLNLSLFLDFHFNKLALEVMANDILASNSDFETPDNNLLLSALNYITPNAQFTDYYNGITSYGSSKTTLEVLKSKIVISNVKMVWNDERKVFYSIEPISIHSIDGIVINKTIDGVVEISKYGGIESITMLFNTKSSYGENYKYFFFYHNNNMFTFSTNDVFSDMIRSDKKKIRRLKRKKGLPAYQYIIATSEKFREFCSRYGY